MFQNNVSNFSKLLHLRILKKKKEKKNQRNMMYKYIADR